MLQIEFRCGLCIKRESPDSRSPQGGLVILKKLKIECPCRNTVTDKIVVSIAANKMMLLQTEACIVLILLLHSSGSTCLSSYMCCQYVVTHITACPSSDITARRTVLSMATACSTSSQSMVHRTPLAIMFLQRSANFLILLVILLPKNCTKILGSSHQAPN